MTSSTAAIELLRLLASVKKCTKWQPRYGHVTYVVCLLLRSDTSKSVMYYGGGNAIRSRPRKSLALCQVAIGEQGRRLGSGAARAAEQGAGGAIGSEKKKRTTRLSTPAAGHRAEFGTGGNDGLETSFIKTRIHSNPDVVHGSRAWLPSDLQGRRRLIEAEI